MKRLFKLIIIAILGLSLSFGIHSLPKVKAEQPVFNQRSALALVQVGKEYYETGKFSQAAQVLQQAAQAYALKGDILKQAQVLSLVSLAQQKLGQWQEAEETVDSSLALLETAPKVRESFLVYAQILNNQGHLQLALGKAENALKTWESAETFYAQIGDQIGVSGSLINQAQAWESLGFYRRSCNTVLQALRSENLKCESLTEEKLNQVLKDLQKQPDSLRVTGLRSLGNALRSLGKLNQSEQILEQSLAVAKQLRSPQQTTQALLSIGNTEQAKAIRAKDLKNLKAAQVYTQAAIKSYQQAAATANSSGKSLPLTLIQAQLNQLSLLVATQQKLNAQNLLPQLQAEINNLPPSQASVYAQVNFAQSLTNFKHNKTDIAKILNSAVQDAQTIGDQRAESYALGNLAQLQSQGNSLNLLERALYLAQKENAPEIAYRWQWQMGRIYQQQENPEKAIAAYKAAYTNLQLLRSDLVALNREIQFSFREKVEPVYRELAGLLLQSPQGKMPSQEKLKEAREVIEALQIAELDNYFQDACAKLKTEEIERIDTQAAVIYTIILPERLEVILSLPNETLHHHTNFVSQTEVEQNVELLKQYLKEPDRLRDVQKLSQQLYAWLIEPFEAELEIKLNPEKNQIKTLVFVLDSLLQNIPMAALYDGKQYLVERYATAITPGLRLLGPERLSPQINTLFAAVSENLKVGNQEFTALGNVVQEWQKVQSIVPSEPLFNSRLTKANLEQQLESNPFSVVHIATHGQFSSDPEATFILLWNQVLNVNDLDNLLKTRNQADLTQIKLLILSACETARGDKRAALGLAGVAVRAGASSTLATLWQVNDESTAELMGQFYRELKANTNVTKAEALRQAQLKLWENTRQDWQVPSFWSAYVLVGNWL